MYMKGTFLIYNYNVIQLTSRVTSNNNLAPINFIALYAPNVLFVYMLNSM